MEDRKQIIVGVNAYQQPDDEAVELLEHDAGLEQAQQERADLRSAGTLVTASGGHGTQTLVGAIPTLDNAASADRFVEERVAEGSDYIKLVRDDFSFAVEPVGAK